MPLDQTVALGVKPPEGPQSALNALNSYSQYQNSQKDLETKEYNLRSDQLARAANEVLQAPEGSPERKALWDHNVKQLHNRGYLNNVEADHFIRSGPSSLVLNQAIARGTKVSEHQQMTGATTEAEAAARDRHDSKETDGTKAIVYPGSMPGSPSQQRLPGVVYGPGGPGPGTGVGGATPPPVTGARPGGPVPSSATTVGDKEGEDLGLYPKPVKTVSITPPPAPAAAKAPLNPTLAKGEYYKNAPSDPIVGADAMPHGQGVVQTGIHPLVQEAGKASLKQQMEDIEPAAVAAEKTKGSLGTMRSELQSGRVTSNSLAELKMAVAGFINAATGEKDGKTAKDILGGDLPSAEILNKETTRMGLLFARQTEGAREAVQAIRIALGANPSMLNTVKGNLKIMDIMDAASNYDIERAKAFKEYSAKQLDSHGNINTRGFDSWFSNNYSPSQFISKAVPYQLPASKAELKPGITYEHTDPKSGKTITETYKGQ